MTPRGLLIFVMVAALGNLFVAFFVATLGLLVGVLVATAIDVAAFILLSWRS